MIHIEAAGVDGLLARAAAGTDHVHLVDGGADREEIYDRFANAPTADRTPRRRTHPDVAMMGP